MRQIWCALLAILVQVVAGTSAAPLSPSMLAYRGAFRLPSDVPDTVGWMWSGNAGALTHYPGGDPTGPGDGYPGSLFGTGHAWHQFVSEVSIPVPVVSRTKDVEELNTATTLQPFADIRGDLFPFHTYDIPKAGLAYLPKQGQQTTDKLYFCWGNHIQDGNDAMTHGWCDLNLSDPHPAGMWRLGNYGNLCISYYMLTIPPAWASLHTPGLLVGSGRFRDGGQCSRGPSLFAFAPWEQGNPPPPNTRLDAAALLLYSDTTSGDNHVMSSYSPSDDWSGAAWLMRGDTGAVIFAGTKARGRNWYGNPAGPCMECDERGWWADSFESQLLLYNPDDLAKVAHGQLAPWQPQPYASIRIDSCLYAVDSSRLRFRLGAATCDRQNGLLYVVEHLGDVDDRSLVHVWQYDPSVDVVHDAMRNMPGMEIDSYPGGLVIRFRTPADHDMSWTVHDVRGCRIDGGSRRNRGVWQSRQLRPGVYIARVRCSAWAVSKQVQIIR